MVGEGRVHDVDLFVSVPKLYYLLYQVMLSFRYKNIISSMVKGSIFLKNIHFIIQERFHKLIYGINTIIKCGT